ncbi:hypothetical protein [Mesorhizobium sp. 43Arga]
MSRSARPSAQSEFATRGRQITLGALELVKRDTLRRGRGSDRTGSLRSLRRFRFIHLLLTSMAIPPGLSTLANGQKINYEIEQNRRRRKFSAGNLNKAG